MAEPHQTCIAGHPCALRSDRPHTIHTCNDSRCICHRSPRERAAWLAQQQAQRAAVAGLLLDEVLS